MQSKVPHLQVYELDVLTDGSAGAWNGAAPAANSASRESHQRQFYC